MSEPELRIPVGVVVSRRKASNPWQDFIWRPDRILVGEPDTAPRLAASTATDAGGRASGSVILDDSTACDAPGKARAADDPVAARARFGVFPESIGRLLEGNDRCSMGAALRDAGSWPCVAAMAASGSSQPHHKTRK